MARMAESVDAVRRRVLGRRVMIQDQKATIRFYGPVEGTEGIWYGVEWDDASRGKHDGQRNGMRYFNVASETGGSFVREKKIVWGIGFVEALRSQYAYADEDGGAAAGVEIRTAGGKKLTVEMVGHEKLEHKQKKLAELREVGLRSLPVCGCFAGGPSRPPVPVSAGADLHSFAAAHGHLLALAPRIEELDLTDTLVGDWLDIAEAAVQLPKLELLRLNANALSFAGPACPHAEAAAAALCAACAARQTSSTDGSARVFPSLPTAPFARLNRLFLNRTRVDWAQVRALAPALTALRELHLCFNGISSFADNGGGGDGGGGDASTTSTIAAAAAAVDKPSAVVLPHLTLLNVEGNALGSWERMSAVLPQLPALSTLIANANGIGDLSPPSPAPWSWPNLTALSLTDNRIEQWRSVDQLAATFPALGDFRLKGNKVLSVDLFLDHAAAAAGAPPLSAAGARVALIARLPTLRSLNGSAVGDQERRDAERYYLSHVGSTWGRVVKEREAGGVAGEAAYAAFVGAHPTFEALAKAHGDPLTSHKEPTSSALSSRLLTLTFAVKDGSCAGKTLVKKLPPTMTVGKMKGLLARLTKIPATSLKLVNIGGGDIPETHTAVQHVEVEFDDDLRELSFYDVFNKDTITVQEA